MYTYQLFSIYLMATLTLWFVGVASSDSWKRPPWIDACCAKNVLAVCIELLPKFREAYFRRAFLRCIDKRSIVAGMLGGNPLHPGRKCFDYCDVGMGDVAGLTAWVLEYGGVGSQ